MFARLVGEISRRLKSQSSRRTLVAAREAMERGQAARAQALAARAVREDDRSAEAHALLGVLRSESGDAGLALQHLRSALALAPHDAAVHDKLGVVLLNAGRHAEAAGCFCEAVRLDPALASAHCNLGVLAARGGNLDEAQARFRRALALDPALPEAVAGYAMTLRETERYDEAERVLRDHLARAPESRLMRRQLALILRETGRFGEAEGILEELLAQSPDDAEAWSQLGLVAQDQAHFARAAAAFAHALRLRPQDAQTRLRRAFGHLARGNFGEGWHDWEARFETEESPERGFPFPRWDGSPLEGKSILVYAEQGVGDEILFASCVPDVIERAAACVLECHPSLGALFGRSFPGARVVPAKRAGPPGWLDDVGPVDWQAAVGSLPRWLRNAPADFSLRRPFLAADPRRVAAWRCRLDELGPGVKVGLGWRGGLGKTMGRVRTMQLEQLLPVLRTPQHHFVSLQHGDVEPEIRRLADDHHARVLHWPEAHADLDETAALVAALDAVVTVPTTVLHLAGGLGRPASVLLPACTNWRFPFEGQRTPWYASVRLFRQERIGEWSAPVERVARELAGDAR